MSLPSAADLLKVQLRHASMNARWVLEDIDEQEDSPSARLGVGVGREVLVVGPPNDGLTDPGHAALIALGQVTMLAFALHRSDDAPVRSFSRVFAYCIK